MIYFITDGEFVKIGFTDSADVSVRLAAIQIGNARKLTVIDTIEGDQAAEACLHRLLSEFRVRGEWFDLKRAYPIQPTQKEPTQKEGYYECVCGQVYGIPQSYSAHTRHCDAYSKVSQNGQAANA